VIGSNFDILLLFYRQKQKFIGKGIKYSNMECIWILKTFSEKLPSRELHYSVLPQK
jgi:hypothetical protein